MKKVVFLALISIFTANLMVGPPKVELVKAENRIDVVIGGEPFTSYLYGSDLTKPLLVPVRTPSGIEVSRRFPLTSVEGGSSDHEHHVGIFFAVDKVNGVNFWKNTSISPQIRHMEITEMAGGAGTGKLSAVSHWIDDKRQVLLEERRNMVFLAGQHENEYAIDLSMDLTAKCPRVVFEDIEEGMFAIRLSDYLRESDPETSPQPAGRYRLNRSPVREDISAPTATRRRRTSGASGLAGSRCRVSGRAKSSALPFSITRPALIIPPIGTREITACSRPTRSARQTSKDSSRPNIAKTK